MSPSPPAPDLKLFLASSSELELERVYVGDFFNDINSTLAGTDAPLRLRLLKWESFDPSYKGERKQAEYNRQIEASDIFVALFRTKDGKYTIEETEAAVAAHAGEHQKPQELYCFLQETSEKRDFDANELKSKLGADYVFDSFTDIADLKYKLIKILWQRLIAGGVEVAETGGFVQINAVNILKVSAKNV